MTPSHFVIFFKGGLLQISPGLEIIIVYFDFTNFGVLELYKIIFTEFGVLRIF